MINFESASLLAMAVLAIWLLRTSYKSQMYYTIYITIAGLFVIIASISGRGYSSIEEGSIISIISLFFFITFATVAPVIHKKIVDNTIPMFGFVVWSLTAASLIFLFALVFLMRFMGVKLISGADYTMLILIVFVALSIQTLIIMKKHLRL